MVKITKIGAAAIALALSITLITPISAKAEVIVEYERDANGDITNKTYKDEDTKESISEKDYTIYDPSAVKYVIPKAVTISVGTYNSYIEIKTTKDVAKFKNFKGSKKALKAKVIASKEYTDPATEKVATDPDYIAKNGGTCYFRNIDGTITDIPNAEWETKGPKGDDSGCYRVRLYATKAGTYKLKFDAVKKDGTTVKKTIKVIAKEDGGPIKSITFGGKLIAQSAAESSGNKDWMWAKYYGWSTTTAKSGVIKVSMNDGFKLKKIEVGKPVVVTDKTAEGEVKINYKKDYASTLDLAYDSEEENWIPVTWKKAKNGKKIKLSKVDTSIIDDPIGDEELNVYNEKTYTVKSKDIETKTYVRITYYNKKSKTTSRLYLTLCKVKK
ncbi:MAG: hypothetical protein K6E70_04200 [Butyrivibrio sp.]|nr:hypothetical protein [Butyrivibrio sp.]